MGIGFLVTRSVDEARASLAEARNLAPENPISQVLLKMTGPEGTWQVTDNDVRLLTTEMPEKYVRLMLGNLLVMLGQSREGLEQFRAANRIDRTDPDVVFALTIALGRAGRAAESIPHLRSFLDHEPRHPSMHWLLGMAYSQKGERDKAFEEFAAAARLGFVATTGLEFRILAAVHAKRRMKLRAIKDLLRAAELGEVEVEADMQAYVGSFAFEELSRGEANASDAIAVLKRVASRFPGAPMCHVALGKAYEATKQFQKAHEAYVSAERLLADPKTARSLPPGVSLRAMAGIIKGVRKRLAEKLRSERDEDVGPATRRQGEKQGTEAFGGQSTLLRDGIDDKEDMGRRSR